MNRPLTLLVLVPLVACTPEAAPALFTDPETLDFAAADTDYRPRISASVGNAGAAPAELVELIVEGDGADYVRLVAPTLPAILEPGGRLGFAIELIDVPPSTLSSQLRVTTADSVNTLVVPLSVSMVGELPPDGPVPPDDPPDDPPGIAFIEVWTVTAGTVEAFGWVDDVGTMHWDGYFAEGATGGARRVQADGTVSECSWYNDWEEGWGAGSGGEVLIYRDFVEHDCDFAVPDLMPQAAVIDDEGIHAEDGSLWWQGTQNMHPSGWWMDASSIVEGEPFVTALE